MDSKSINSPCQTIHQDSSDDYQSASETTPCEGTERSSQSANDIVFPAANENCRNLIAYWLLGLTNNFAYVVMLSAAHDILAKDFANESMINGTEYHNLSSSISSVPNIRDCNSLSTGTILLADIIPALIVKLMAPFICARVHLRISCVILLCTLAFLLVGLSTNASIAILGVVCASASSGLGETTFLAYSAYFSRNVISTWSSGTGGAGVLGALSYAALTSLGLTSQQTLILMLLVPLVMGLSFWSLLEHPPSNKCCRQRSSDYLTAAACQTEEDGEPLLEYSTDSRLTFDEKLRIIPSLFKYMLPLSSVYIAEYLINQGLSELLYFPGDAFWITHAEQYRWYQVIYSVGVLISRSSVNIIYIRRIWITAVFQWLNVVIFLTASIYWWLGSIWVAFALIFWEGILGGAAYVNTFYKLSKEIIPEQQEFALQVTCMSDTLGITISGLIALPLHNAICKLPIL